MQVYVKNRRKDGKYTVILSYNNGVKLTKILTTEQLQKEQENART